MKKGDHLFLVDGSAYIFRAYHALPPLTRKSDGMPVGAVSGFCNMLWKLVEETKDTSVGVVPSHFAVIFDHSSTTFRNALYDGYKANRPAPPEDLVPQFALIREAVRAFDLPCIEKQGFEADDLIATYTKKALEAGGDVTIVSSDKDLMQLVGPCVTLYDQMKDKRLGPAEVFEKFGVYPEKMIDLQALVGDASDNVPGVPGIGPKTAAQLLEEFGDLETLLSRAGEIKQAKRRENLTQFAHQARLSQRLVTLDDNTPLDVPLEELSIREPDGEKLIGYLKAMEFTTLTRRVSAKLGTEAASVPAAEVDVTAPARGPDLDPGGIPGGDKSDAHLPLTPAAFAAGRMAEMADTRFDRSAYATIRDLETLDRWIERARETGLMAFDVETTALDAMNADIVGLAIAVAPGEAAYIPLAHVAEGEGDLLGGGDAASGPGIQIPEAEALARLAPALTDPAILKIGQNFKFDYLVMLQRGIAIQPFDDTMLISYALDASSSLDGHGMDELSERFLGHKPVSYKELCGSGKGAKAIAACTVEKVTEYAGEDADVTLRLWEVLKPRLVADGLVHVYERLERPLVPVLARMEQRGIKVDRQILSRLSGRFAQKAAALEADIHALAGESFNPGSPKQLGEILFGKLGLPGGKKTRTGQWSTDARTLEDLAAEGHDLPRHIVDWRQITKLKGHLYRRPAAAHGCGGAHPHVLFHGVHDNRAAFVVRAEPAEHPGTYRRRTRDPHRLRGRWRHAPRLGRLQPDRAAHPGAHGRYPAARAGFPRRHRHPCHDGVGDVRSAGRGHGALGAPPCQGHQLRHHLWHLCLRPCSAAVHPARRGRAVHPPLLRAFSRYPGLYGRDQGPGEGRRLRGNPVRPPRALSGYPPFQPIRPRLQRARGHQCPDPGHGGRHHPPRHDPHGRRTRRRGAVGAHAAAGS